jgi:hypothetical protein
MFVATHNGFGIYTNEMQRNVNGLGHAGHSGAGGYYGNRIIPYGYYRAYSPRDARGRGYIGKWPPLYHDPKRRKNLGDIPNDFEASVDLQYIPVRQAWYYGEPVNGSGYPDAQRRQLGDAASDAALQQLAKTERLQTVLQVISTAAIATIASLAIAKAIRGNKNGHVFGDDD